MRLDDVKDRPDDYPPEDLAREDAYERLREERGDELDAFDEAKELSEQISDFCARRGSKCDTCPWSLLELRCPICNSDEITESDRENFLDRLVRTEL